MELRTLIYGLAIFLVSAVAVTLLGFGGAAGNASGLLFWVVLVVLGIAFGLSRVSTSEEGVLRLARRARNRDRR